MRRWAVAAFLAACATHAYPQAADELRALLERGDARAAYALGRKAPERLGNPDFDLAFGVAAIHAGHPAEGVLALERVLLLDPRNDPARVELARGYFLLGEDARAREEFEAALARNPPAAAAQTIREHLAALRERESRYKRTAAAYVEVGGGYDSNPRAGVDDPLITLPVLGEVDVGEAGVRVSDRNAVYGAGFRLSAPLFPRVAAFAAGQAEALRYGDERAFDQEHYAGSAGFVGQWGRHGWRVGASTGYQTLGRQPYRRTHGAFADATFALSERDQLSVGLQGGRMRYAGANEVRDSDFHLALLGWRHAFRHGWQPVVDIAVNGGEERNLHGDRHDLSRRFWGARAGAALQPLAGWVLGGSALYQRSDYREPDAILETRREDRYVAGQLTLSWSVTPELTLRADVTEARNDSNLELYEYRRRTALLRGRYEFR